MLSFECYIDITKAMCFQLLSPATVSGVFLYDWGVNTVHCTYDNDKGTFHNTSIFFSVYYLHYDRETKIISVVIAYYSTVHIRKHEFDCCTMDNTKNFVQFYDLLYK